MKSNTAQFVFAFLLLATTSPATASNGWQKRVQVLIDAYEQSASAPKPIVYPQLAKRVRLQFPPDRTIHISWSSVQSDGKAVRGELYSRPGELFVVQQDEGWNLVTKGDYVYEWETGHATGIRIKRNDGDLVDYALYLTDPALFMTSLYYEFLLHPESFETPSTDTGGIVRLQLKQPLYGFESILISNKPLWFRGYSIQNRGLKVSAEFRISEPSPIPSIPPSVTDRVKDIRFTDSKDTLERHMDYL